jgi:uncharacterized membrane protein HdeD (DUF308 family)
MGDYSKGLWLLMRRELSGVIGVVGGCVDLLVGSLILQQNSMVMSSMRSGSATFAGYFLIGLGVIVLATGVSLLASKIMNHLTGLLMIIYGLIMLIIGAGMLAQVVNFMMQSSWLSGIVMILLGLAMLYSGSNMTKMM